MRGVNLTDKRKPAYIIKFRKNIPQIPILKRGLCISTINKFALKAKSAMIMKADPQKHQNTIASQANLPFQSVLGLSGSTNQQRENGCVEVKELGDQSHSSESQQDQLISLSKSLHRSKSSLPPLAREVGENPSSFPLKELFSEPN